jgi:hypothetical protein
VNCDSTDEQTMLSSLTYDENWSEINSSDELLTTHAPPGLAHAATSDFSTDLTRFKEMQCPAGGGYDIQAGRAAGYA